MLFTPVCEERKAEVTGPSESFRIFTFFREIFSGLPNGVVMKSTALSAAMVLAAAGILLAATYTYRCAKCGLIQQYTVPGIYKCPNDGQYMDHR